MSSSPSAEARVAHATVVLDGALSRAQLIAIADGARVELADEARERVEASHGTLTRWLLEGHAAYGASSGVGDLRDVAVTDDARDRHQLNIVRSHCSGIGSPLPARLVRAALALRAATFARGYSAVRPRLVDHMLAMLNGRVHPVVPAHGSVGASGDPVPLAHLALGVVGEGTAQLGDGAALPAAEALALEGLEPFRLTGREGLALVNGLDFTLAAAVLAHARAQRLLQWGDAIAALTLDALGAASDPFSPDVQALRGAGRHRDVAATITRLRGEAPRQVPWLQDPYCLRCVAQVHGASWTALDRHAATLDHELSAVIDNPLVFADADDVRHCGHFHGQELALAADQLALGLTSLANIAQARISLLLRGTRGLPRVLSPEPGIACGLMMLETTGAALVARMRAMAAPLSVHSLAASPVQEDHTSMSWEAVRRTDALLPQLAAMLAAELIAAAEGVRLRDAPKGPGARILLETVEASVGAARDDRPLGPELELLGALLLDHAPPTVA